MSWNFSYGDRVFVKNVPLKYSKCYPDIREAPGTVKNVYGSNIAVKLDNFCHESNSRGYFYFGPGDLRFASLAAELSRYDYDLEQYIKNDIESTREICVSMKSYDEFIHDAVEAKFKKEETPMLKNYRVAGIKFKDGYNPDKTYPYALYDEGIVIGDTVVVMTGHHGMAIAEVCSIGEMSKDSVTCGREIICKVDMTAYIDRKARAKQMAELKKEMDEKVKALQETALYELMAEKDPSLKALLEKFKSLEA